MDQPIISSIGDLSADIAIIDHENISNISNMITTYLFLVSNQNVVGYELILPV